MKCSKNPLDVLFRDIQRDLDLDLEAERRAKKDLPKLSTYANPLNWTLGRVVELIHLEEGSLGKFQEYFHKLSPSARRLLPAAAEAVTQTTEHVWGEFWLHPKFHAPEHEDSEAEIHSIILRFEELMEEEFTYAGNE
jgi:hypothetical protein